MAETAKVVDILLVCCGCADDKVIARLELAGRQAPVGGSCRRVDQSELEGRGVEDMVWYGVVGLVVNKILVGNELEW